MILMNGRTLIKAAVWFAPFAVAAFALGWWMGAKGL